LQPINGGSVKSQCVFDALICADSLWNISGPFYSKPASRPLHNPEAIQWYVCLSA